MGGTNTLDLSAGTLLGNIGVDGAGTTLNFDQSANATLTNVITGTGAVIDSGAGTLTLSGANTYTGGTTLSGGTVELGQQSSAGTGPITFGAGDETLQLDSTGTLAAAVTSFVVGDSFDLTAVASTATASYTGGVLTVSDGSNSDQISIAAAPSGDEYVVSNDGGHALVTLAALPSPAFTAPAQNSDINNNEPTISGIGVSGDTVDLSISNGSGNPMTVSVPVTSGVWSYTPTTALPDGTYAVFASQTSPSGMGTSPQVADGFTIDTTPPTTSSPTLTVAQNAGPTPIGIAAPSDNLTPTANLAIMAGTPPTDGTVTLADGTTPVTAGETLTAAQLTGLEFTPTPGAFSQGSTFTYTATDGAGNASSGTAALDIGSAGAPTLTGTHATSTNAEAAVMPFAGVTLSDPSAGTETLGIMLQNGGGALAGTGLVANAGGTYTLTGSAVTVTQELDGLSFTPSAPTPGTAATTTFVLSDTSSAGTSVTDVGTSVTDTAAVPTTDTVSIDPNAAFVGQGTFILSGTASSPAGVKSVEISARVGGVDGVTTDLGAATLNGDGTWSFDDHVGRNVQGFITATVTDDAGGTASVTPSTSLQAGITGRPYVARQDNYTADGSAYTSTDFEHRDLSRTVAVKAGGQTLQSQYYDTFANGGQGSTTFVFSPGYEYDQISEFRPGGAAHDTVELPSSDFTSFADVLRHTQNTSAGAVIHDPKSGDSLLIEGLSKPAVHHYAGDFTFHA